MKPKLLIVADTFYPKVDGTLRFMEEFIKRAADQFDISLMVPDFGAKSHRKMAGVRSITYVSTYKRIKVSGYPSMRFSFKNIRQIKKAITEADLVFVQGPALISYLSMYFGAKYHKKTFFYTHTIAWELFEKFFPPFFNRFFFRIIKKLSILMYNKCTVIIVPYHELRKHLQEEGITTEMKVARLGVDIDLFSPSKDKKKSKESLKLANLSTIGYVGRISKEKNPGILLQAFRRLKNQERLHLLMVGDGPEDQKKEFQSLKNCTITGFVNNVYDYAKAMDIFVMPSLTETTSLATLEAMSCGVPVVVSKVGFMKNYIVKDYNGLFFPKNSASTLAMKLQKLLDDSSLRARLGQNARKTVAYSFSLERSISKITRLLLQEYYKQ